MDVGKLSTSFAEGHIFYFILHGSIVDETRRQDAKQYYYVVTTTPSCEEAFYFLCHSLCDVHDQRRLQRWHAYFIDKLSPMSFDDFAGHVRRAPQWNSASGSVVTETAGAAYSGATRARGEESRGGAASHTETAGATAAAKTDATSTKATALVRTGSGALALTVCPALYLDETSARAGLASYVRYHARVQQQQQQQRQHHHQQQQTPPIPMQQEGLDGVVPSARKEEGASHETARRGSAAAAAAPSQQTGRAAHARHGGRTTSEVIVPTCLTQLLPQQSSSTPEKESDTRAVVSGQVGGPGDTTAARRVVVSPRGTAAAVAVLPTDIAMHNHAASLSASAEEMSADTDTRARANTSSSSASSSAALSLASSPPVLWQALIEHVQKSLRQPTGTKMTNEADTLLRQEVQELRAELQRVRAELEASRSFHSTATTTATPPRACDHSASHYEAALREARRQLDESQQTHARVCAEMQRRLDDVAQHAAVLRREHAAQLSAVVQDNRVNLSRIEGVLRHKEKELRAVYEKALQTRDIRLTQLSEQVWRLEHERHRMTAEMQRLRRRYVEEGVERAAHARRDESGEAVPGEVTRASSGVVYTGAHGTHREGGVTFYPTGQDFLRATVAEQRGGEDTPWAAHASRAVPDLSVRTCAAVVPFMVSHMSERGEDKTQATLASDASPVVRHLQNELQNAHALIHTLRVGLQTVKASLPDLAQVNALSASELKCA